MSVRTPPTAVAALGTAIFSSSPPQRENVIRALTPNSSVAAYRHAAIDDDFGAGDEARFVRGEEQRRVGSIAPVAGEAQRDALESRFQQRLDVAARALLREARFDHRRVQLARYYGVDSNSLCRVLRGDHSRELDPAGLGRCVG